MIIYYENVWGNTTHNEKIMKNYNKLKIILLNVDLIVIKYKKNLKFDW